ncbi:MAG: hypothetical protein ACXVEF_25700 [Polyangiales bacterium]
MSEWRRPLLFFAATLAVLALYGLHAPLHLDTARDLLIAKNCVLGPRCEGAGPTTSFGGLVQGALWSHVLEARERWGFSIAALERFVDLSLALSAGLLALTAHFGFRRKPTLFMWIAWLVMTVTAIGYPILWNPTLSPLPIAAFHLALAIGARTGKTFALVVAAAALAFSIDLHVAYSVMVPFFLMALVALARQPLLALAYSLALMAEIIALESPGAYRHNLARAAPFTGTLIAGLVVACAIGFALRKPLRRRPAGERPWIVAVSSSLYFVVMLLALSRVGGRAIEERYLGPVVPPLAILFGAAIEWVLPVLLVPIGEVAIVIAMLVMRPPKLDQILLRDAEPIARELYAHASFDDLFVHLRGPEAFPLLGTVAALEPPRRSGPSGLEEDILVVRSSKGAPAELPPNARVIELGGGSVAIVIRYAAKIDGRQMEVCLDGDCHAIAVDPADLSGRHSIGWYARAYPSIGAMLRAFGGRNGRMTYRFRLRPGAPSKVVASALFCPRWRIESATGATSQLPGRSTLVVAPEGGDIVFSVYDCPNDGWLPAFAEVPAGLSDTLFP